MSIADPNKTRARGAALLDIRIGILGKLDGRGLRRNGKEWQTFAIGILAVSEFSVAIRGRADMPRRYWKRPDGAIVSATEQAIGEEC
jgi:hypothetical protein